MVATPSTMLPLGTQMPDFALQDVVSGETIMSDSLCDVAGVCVMFVCNHCPFVKHILSELGRVVQDYTFRSIAFAAISSNDIDAYPADAPDQMRALAQGEGWSFPYLFDETQEVAKAFRAACTPDFYVFDGERRLVYRGQLDDSRPGNDAPVTGADLRRALEAVVTGRAVTPDQKPSMGCNIKWKVGNAPEYFRG
jgi:thiol-disulfide isomerase/thioredoxin